MTEIKPVLRAVDKSKETKEHDERTGAGARFVKDLETDSKSKSTSQKNESKKLEQKEASGGDAADDHLTCLRKDAEPKLQIEKKESKPQQIKSEIYQSKTSEFKNNVPHKEPETKSKLVLDSTSAPLEASLRDVKQIAKPESIVLNNKEANRPNRYFSIAPPTSDSPIILPSSKSQLIADNSKISPAQAKPGKDTNSPNNNSGVSKIVDAGAERNKERKYGGGGGQPAESGTDSTIARSGPKSGGGSNTAGELARNATQDKGHGPQMLDAAPQALYPKQQSEVGGRGVANQPAEKSWVQQLAQKHTGEQSLAWGGPSSNAPSFNKDGGGEFGKQKFEPGSSGQHKEESNPRQGASDNAGWSTKDSGSSKSHENKSASDNAPLGTTNSYSRDQGSDRGQNKQESFKPEGSREDSHSFNNTKLASIDGVRSSEPIRAQESMRARESIKGPEGSHGGNGMESKGVQSVESAAKAGLGGKDHSMALESMAADKLAKTSAPSSPEFTGKNNAGVHAGDTVSSGKDKKGFDVAPGEQSTVEAKGSGKFNTQDGIGSGKAGDKLDALHDFMTKGDGKGKGSFTEDPRWAILNDGKGKAFDDKSIFAGLKGLGDSTGLSGKQQDISFLTDKFSGIRHTSESIVSTSMSMMASLINAAQEKIIKNIQIPNISEASLIGLPIDNSIKLSNQISSKPLGLGDSLDVKGFVIKNSNEPANKDLGTVNKDLGTNKDLGISKEQGIKEQIGKDPGTKEPGLDPLTPKLEPKGLGSIDAAGRDGKNAELSAKDSKSSLPDGKFGSDGRAFGDSGKAVSDERKPQDIRSSIDALLINLANGVTPAVKFVDNQIENMSNLNIKTPVTKEQPDQIEQGAGESTAATSEATSQSRQDTASRKRYVVKPVDTISSIATAVLGDERYAKLLVTINRANVEVVTRNFKEVVILRPGQSLLLPSLNEMEVHQKAYFPAPSATE